MGDPDMSQPHPLSFIVLAGFLGSGKTTLLCDFLAERADGDTAVIVNDVGEINIDGAIIAFTGDLPMATLSNGCVCCSLTNDLLYTIEALLEERHLSGAPPFARIVLECSGIATPGPIVRSLGALAHLDMRVKVVTTYSCTSEHEVMQQFEEAVSQLAAAHAVVLTKLDLVDELKRAAAQTNARALSPLADIVVETDRGRRASLAFAQSLPVRHAGSLEKLSLGSVHPRVGVYHLEFDRAVSWERLSEWLENLTGYFDERLLRLKGFVQLDDYDGKILLQGVGSHIDLPRLCAQIAQPSSLIVILRDVSIDELAAIQPALPLKPISRGPRMKRPPSIGAVPAQRQR